MWQTKMGTGGGIRANNPPEVPGSIPYVEVKDIRAAFNKAIDNGAVEMFGPNKLPRSRGYGNGDVQTSDYALGVDDVTGRADVTPRGSTE